MLAAAIGNCLSASLLHCLELFEDYCIVTQSVRQGIDVDVEVKPASEPPVP